jgi:hypothetical protein
MADISTLPLGKWTTAEFDSLVASTVHYLGRATRREIWRPLQAHQQQFRGTPDAYSGLQRLESSIRRLIESGEIARVASGIYESRREPPALQYDYGSRTWRTD